METSMRKTDLLNGRFGEMTERLNRVSFGFCVHIWSTARDRVLAIGLCSAR